MKRVLVKPCHGAGHTQTKGQICFRVMGVGPWKPGYHVRIWPRWDAGGILVCYLWHKRGPLSSEYVMTHKGAVEPSKKEAQRVVDALQRIGRLAPALATIGLKGPKRPKL